MNTDSFYIAKIGGLQACFVTSRAELLT